MARSSVDMARSFSCGCERALREHARKVALIADASVNIAVRINSGLRKRCGLRDVGGRDARADQRLRRFAREQWAIAGTAICEPRGAARIVGVETDQS